MVIFYVVDVLIFAAQCHTCLLHLYRVRFILDKVKALLFKTDVEAVCSLLSTELLFGMLHNCIERHLEILKILFSFTYFIRAPDKKW